MYGPTPSGPALGIDLGTSHTIGVVRRLDGAVRPLLFDGSPLLPSAVYAAPDGSVTVGRDAVHSGRRHPERFEPNPKRHIDAATVLLGDREIATTALLAALLRTVAVECRRVVGPPGQVTITVPADWGPQRRNAVGAAAAAAGLGQVRLVPEPVAAASYFAETLGRSIAPGAALVVYDLGAGTFDVSIVRHEPQGLRTVALAGRSDLGGLDIDAALIDHLGTVYGGREEWRHLVNPTTLEERRALREFQEEVRAAKERLSRHQQADLTVPLLGVEAHLTRDELDRIASPLLERTVALTRQVLADAGVEPSRGAGVFLVGGATRMPLVATLLHRALGVAPTVLDQPEIVVAEGSITGAALAAPATPPVPLRAYTPQTPTPPAGPITSSPPRALAPQRPPAPLSLPPTAVATPPVEERPPKMRWPVVIAVIAANIVLVAALVLIFRDRGEESTDDGTADPASLTELAAAGGPGQLLAGPIDAHEEPVTTLAAVEDQGTTVLFTGGAGGRTVAKWDLETQRRLGSAVVARSALAMRALEFSDGETRVVMLDEEGGVLVWDAEEFVPEEARAESGIDASILDADLLRHEEVAVFAAASDAGFGLYDLEARAAVSLCAYNKEGTLPFAYARVVELDGKATVLTAFDEGWLRRYDTSTCEIIGEDFGGPETGSWSENHVVERLEYVDAEDGPVAMVFDGEAYHRWDIATGEPVGDPILDASASAFARRTVAIGGREAVLAVDDEGGVLAVDLLSGERITVFGEGTGVTGVDAHRIGTATIAVTGHEDGTVRIWSLGG